VIIDTDAPTLEYNPMIFGGFLEHFDDQVYGGVYDPGSPLADEKGFRRDVLVALKELRIPIVRWPGGCFVSGYHWEFGVGKDRKPVDDMAWGVIESNAFGTDEYIELCRRLNWKPYICTNAGNGTIAEMANWVEYCNGTAGEYTELRKANGHPNPYNVTTWSIGNENYWPTEIGHKPIEQWAPFVRQAAKAMKAVDPDIKLTAAAQATRQWTLPLLEVAGPYLDYISIHSYWLHLWQRHEIPDYLTCIMHSEGPEQTLSDFVHILEESGYRGKIKIAYDEWNLRGWHHPGFPRKTVQDYSDPQVQRLVKARELNDIPSQYTMADALFTASFFNACLRHAQDVAMANIAPIVNTRGPLFVYPEGIVKRTHFHAMAMYANELQPRVGQLNLTGDRLTHGDKSVPVADAVATVDDSGKRWVLALMNRHPEKPLSCTIKFGDCPLEGTFDALVLVGDSSETFNDVDHPNRVAPEKMRFSVTQGLIELPPHSLVILKVYHRETY
jgi:alpha-N-arabinofuranosidase